MHLVDGLRIEYTENGFMTLMDGEDKSIIYLSDSYNKELLEEMVWLYKREVEGYGGESEDMFIR